MSQFVIPSPLSSLSSSSRWWDICTSVQSKYARLPTDLCCAWPVNPQYPTHICHCCNHHHLHSFARWSSLTSPFSVTICLVYYLSICASLETVCTHAWGRGQIKGMGHKSGSFVLFAPTGALYVMLGHYISPTTFWDFHSVHWFFFYDIMGRS